MIIQLIDAIDIGNLGKQRLLFRAVGNGNLVGCHLFIGDSYFYSFPFCEVKKGNYIVLYLGTGTNETRKFADETCHFLYYGERVRLWNEQKDRFKLVCYST